ncbi:hypothetical protein KA017_02765 [Candidatus Woesebacteria bacterium]|nr:hypothetical protein [Candidatus Woesebacteria bacterium]
MGEKLVIVHKSYIQEWASRDEPPLPLSTINAALARIEQLTASYHPRDVVVVEQLPSSGFPILKEQVKRGDSVTLVGARAAYCLRLAREVLEGIGAKVKLDTKGSLS